MTKLVAIALVAASSSGASAGPCAFPTPQVAILGSPIGMTIDQGGGIVVGVDYAYGASEGPASIDKIDWTLGGAAPKVTVLAPGLALLAPATPPKGNAELALADGKKQPIGKVKYVEVLAKLAVPAPKVTGVAYSQSQSMRSSSTSVSAAIGALPPPHTVAVLIYKNGEQKAGKPARAWANVNVPGNPKMTSVTLYAQSRCSAPVGGGEGIAKGDKVVLVWALSDGALSAPSAEFTVK